MQAGMQRDRSTGSVEGSCVVGGNGVDKCGECSERADGGRNMVFDGVSNGVAAQSTSHRSY